MPDYVVRKCNATKSVLFITTQPDRPDVQLDADAIDQACKDTFQRTLHYVGTKALNTHTVVATFRQKGCATRALHQRLNIDGVDITSEPVFPRPPTLFTADMTGADVSENEAKRRIAYALRRWERSGFVAESSRPRDDERIARHVLLRFPQPPGKQCFFIPMRSRGRSSDHIFWAYFRPLSTKAACVVCKRQHTGMQCRRVSVLDMPSAQTGRALQ